MKAFDTLIIGTDFAAHEAASRMVLSGGKIGAVLPSGPSPVSIEEALRVLRGETLLAGKRSFPPEIEIITGSPVFTGPRTLQVESQTFQAKKFLIATGATPYFPPIQGLAEASPQSSFEFIAKEKKPRSLIIVGAGPLGVSTAFYAADKKIETTLIGNKSAVLPEEEPEISAAVWEKLADKKIRVLLGTSVLLVKKEGPQSILVYEKDGVREEITAEEIIFSTGVTPLTEGLHLNIPGVYVTEEKNIVVDEDQRTSCPWIFAAGTVTGIKTGLAVMKRQAEIAAHNLYAPFFSKIKMEPGQPPFTIPLATPFARTGSAEKQARENYKDIRVSITHTPEGLIKLVGRKKGGRILGAHVLSIQAESAILFFDLAIRAEISAFDLLDSHSYPLDTFAETIHQSLKSWTQTS